MCIRDSPVGVLTNNPPFPQQMFMLNNYMNLSPRQPENKFASELDLTTYSRGMGALGLPGDLSSASRFAKVAFTKMNSVSGNSEAESVSQMCIRDRIYQKELNEYPSENDLQTVITLITYIKNMMLSNEEIESLGKKENLPLAEIYKAYCGELRRQSLMDYDDKMVYAYTCLLYTSLALSFS